MFAPVLDNVRKMNIVLIRPLNDMKLRFLTRDDPAEGILASCVSHWISVTSYKFNFVAGIVQGLEERLNRKM
jgi:hypothetical protein